MVGRLATGYALGVAASAIPVIGPYIASALPIVAIFGNMQNSIDAGHKKVDDLLTSILGGEPGANNSGVGSCSKTE